MCGMENVRGLHGMENGRLLGGGDGDGVRAGRERGSQDDPLMTFSMPGFRSAATFCACASVMACSGCWSVHFEEHSPTMMDRRHWSFFMLPRARRKLL